MSEDLIKELSLKKIINIYHQPIMVQKSFSIGPKLSTAKLVNKYTQLGHDLFNHLNNELAVLVARPISLITHVSAEKLDNEKTQIIIKQLVDQCQKNNINFVEGENIELPGIYDVNEYDLVATITGLTENSKLNQEKNIEPGDVLLGFASNGLQWTGHNLAKKIFFEIGGYNINSNIFELEKNIGDTLIEPELNYHKAVLEISKQTKIKTVINIGETGFNSSLLNILPTNCNLEIKRGSWPVLPIFEVIQRLGKITETRMYENFNMGIGLVITTTSSEVEKTKEIAQKHNLKIYEIGKVTKMTNRIQLI